MCPMLINLVLGRLRFIDWGCLLIGGGGLCGGCYVICMAQDVSNQLWRFGPDPVRLTSRRNRKTSIQFNSSRDDCAQILFHSGPVAWCYDSVRFGSIPGPARLIRFDSSRNDCDQVRFDSSPIAS